MIQSHVSSWQASLALIAASVTEEGGEKAVPGTAIHKPKLIFITACQITACLHTGSPPASPDSLSGTRFRNTHLNSGPKSNSFSQPAGQCCAWLPTNLIAFASANKLSEPVFSLPETGARFGYHLSQNSKSYKANLGLLERDPHISFHPLSHKILHLTPCNEGRGRERKNREPAPAPVTKPHQGHTNIASVQLLSALGWRSLIMKHYRGSLSAETNR